MVMQNEDTSDSDGSDLSDSPTNTSSGNNTHVSKTITSVSTSKKYLCASKIMLYVYNIRITSNYLYQTIKIF